MDQRRNERVFRRVGDGEPVFGEPLFDPLPLRLVFVFFVPLSPVFGITPGIVIGILSMILLTLAILARYAFHLSGAWSRTYAITATTSLYLNVFILVVQCFEKVPALHALAPTQKELPFKITQLVVLVLFVGLTIAAAKGFSRHVAVHKDRERRAA